MIGDYDSIKVEQGKGIYETVARSTGDKEWGGLIKIISPDGEEEYFPFKESYSVSEPNFVVSPTKMNVFYFGIDNPVEVSVPGIPADKINPRIKGGATIKKVRDGYLVKPTKQSGTVNVEVYAEIDGKQKSMGSMPFRIKTVPTPVAKIMGQTSGPIDGALLSKAPGVSAVLDDFVFDLSFRVTRFTVTSTVGGYTRELNQEGNKFSREQKELIQSIKRGQNIIIEKIEAIGPDGRAKPLSPIVFKVK
jgi:gliding motility-associated protein GldM